MRRPTLLATGVALCALVAAGCGSSSSRHRAATPATPSPTATALSYFPANSLLVGIIDTSRTGGAAKQLKSAQAQGPAATVGKAAIFQELAKLGIDYNRDLKPLFGKPLAIGAVGPSAGATREGALLAWQTNSQTALKRLVSKLDGVRPAGTRDGATMYTADGFALATKGALLLVGKSSAAILDALARHDDHQGFPVADYAKDLGDVSRDGVITMVGNPSTLLSRRDAATARRVPWIAALTGYGASIGVAGKDVTFTMHARTDGRSLSDSQLPIASGASSPGLAGALPITLGLRDPAQLWTFGTSVAREVAPHDYAQLRRQEAAAKRQGVDLEKLFAQFSGDMALTSDAHTTVARAQVDDPGFVARTLKRLASHRLTGVANGGGKPDVFRALGGGFYRVLEGGSPAKADVIGLVGSELVAGRAPAKVVRAYATAPAHPTAGSSGALSFRIALANLIRLTDRHASPDGLAFLDRLGDLTGSVQAQTDGMTGRASIAMK